MALLLEASERRAELEGPEEVVGLLESGTDGPNFVNEILNAGNTLFAEGLLNNGVVVEGDARSVDLAEAALVDQLTDGIASGIAIGDVGLNHADHVDGGAVESDDHSVVKLTQTKELHDLLLLGRKLVDTIK